MEAFQLDNNKVVLIGESEPFLLYHPDTGSLFEINKDLYSLLEAKCSAAKCDKDNITINRLELPEASSTIAQITKYLDQFGATPSFQPNNLIGAFNSHRPRNIMLFVTNRCNFKCTYCYESFTDKDIPDVAINPNMLTVGLLDYIRRSTGRRRIRVTFFGGEPLLNFGAIKGAVSFMYEATKFTKQNVSFSISTNLSYKDKNGYF